VYLALKGFLSVERESEKRWRVWR